MFILVLWILEGTYSIIKYSNVVKPRREYEDYGLGEEVEAKFLGKSYPARIVRKGANKKELEKEMDMVIRGFNSTIQLQSEKEKKCVGKNSAETEKKRKQAEAQKEKEQKKEAVKKQKQKLIADLDNELQDLILPAPITSNSPRRSPRKTLPSQVSRSVSAESPGRSPRKRLPTQLNRSYLPGTLYRSTGTANSPRRSPRKRLASEVSRSVSPGSPWKSPRKLSTQLHRTDSLGSLCRSPGTRVYRSVSPKTPPRSGKNRFAQLTPVSPSIFDQHYIHSSPSATTSSPPTSSPASTISTSLLDVETKQSKTKTLARTLNFSDQLPLNSKGHPTVAAKQPRRKCDCCNILREENQVLRKQIEDLKESLSSQDKSASEYARPAAGVYDAEFASQNGMKELFHATRVYLHKDQLCSALNKSVTNPKGQKSGLRDGKRIARYLLTIFFSNNQLQKSSLTASEASIYEPLDQRIIEAIIAFSVYKSDTRRGEILRAMRSSLTSKRCKAKKVMNTSA